MTNLAIIKTYIQLLMKAHGFIFESGDRQGFSYEKKYIDVFGNERRQIIRFDNISMFPAVKEIYLYLTIKIDPSFLYKNIDLSSIFNKNKCRVDAIGAEWTYWDKNALIQILEEIVNVMEEKGFLLLDKCAQDPDDVIPTLEEQQDLLLHHDSYLETFCSNYNVNIECLNDILEIIENEINSMPAKSAGANREKIMILAAALGQVYAVNGGIWEFDNQNQSVRVSIYKSIKIPAGMLKVPSWLVYPINKIWNFVQNKHEGGNIKDYILSSLP